MKDILVNEAHQTSLERAIAEWQGPIYNLAYRMLGNEADAADAAQDVFLTLVLHWKEYDPSRAFKPWLFQLALNRIRNFHRGAAARSRRERLASTSRHTRREEADAMEDEDLKRRVHDALARLPATERSLIVLHYYNGLSHGEMGAVLSLPRTTVQSRLVRALERLRRSMVGLGCVVPAATLEVAMRSTVHVEVPVGLSTSLSALPATAGGSLAVAIPTTLGGLIMAKKISMLAVAVLGCLALGGAAYSTGKWRATAELERALAAEAAAATSSRREQERLLAQQQELSRQVQTLRARLKEQSKASAPDVAEPELAGGAAGKGDGTASDEIVIDWSRLANLLAEHLDLFYELNESGRDRQPTKEEKRIMEELESALQEVFSKARLISDEPFYDARVLLGMCEAIFTPALGLSGAEEAKMRASLAALFSERVEGFDPDAALPAEAYRVRQGFLGGLDDAVGRSLDPGQAEGWEKVSALARRFLEGDRDRVSMPSAPEGGREAREADVLKQWQRAFSLPEGQSSLAQPLASDFINRADSILAGYGQLDPEPRPLTPAERARLNSEILGLQIEVEKQLIRSFTPEQREALRGLAPVILQFAPGNENWSDRRRGSPM
jgi:RNA polymerase sigma-70 factor (ECF subfamily)